MLWQAAAAQQQQLTMTEAMTQAMLGQLAASNHQAAAAAQDGRGTPTAAVGSEEAAARLQAAAQGLSESALLLPLCAFTSRFGQNGLFTDRSALDSAGLGPT